MTIMIIRVPFSTKLWSLRDGFEDWCSAIVNRQPETLTLKR